MAKIVKVTKINKKLVAEYRHLTKLRSIICKGLKFINEKIAGMEQRFHDSAKEFGPQIVDGFIAELAIRPGKKGVEYKAAYMEAYAMLTPAQQKKMDKFLESVTKPAVPTEYVHIQDSHQAYFEGTLKVVEGSAIAQQIEEGLDVTPFA